MKKQKREKTPHSRRGLAPAVRRKRGEKRGAGGSPPAPRPQGSAPGGAGKGSVNGDVAARETAIEIPACACGHSIEEHGYISTGVCEECDCSCFDRV